MQMVLQFILTLVFYVWLFAILVLLWLIWRTSVKHIHRMEITMFDAAMTSAQAAKTAAEAMQQLVEKKHDA
jgi:hypothetical protein